MSDVALSLPMVPFSGTVFYDYSVNSNRATVFGDPAIIPDASAPNGSSYINNSGNYSFLKFDSLGIGGIFTIECIVEPELIPSSQEYMPIFSSPGRSGETDNWCGYTGQSDGMPGRFVFHRQARAAGGVLDLVGSSYCSPGETYHVVLQSDGSNWCLFVNGVLEDSVASSSGFSEQSGGFQVGGQRNPNYSSYQTSWWGKIGDFLVTIGEAKYPKGGFKPPKKLAPSAMEITLYDGGTLVDCSVVGSSENTAIIAQSDENSVAHVIWPLSDIGLIDVTAFLRRGQRFLSSMEVGVGQYIRPSVVNGFRYKVIQSGTLPEMEPDPWPTDGEFEIGSAVVSVFPDRNAAASTQVVAGNDVGLVLDSGSTPPSNAFVSGSLRIDGAAASRTVVAIEKSGLGWRFVGAADSDSESGEYQINGYISGGEVFLLATDKWGYVFVPERIVEEGDLIHPSAPNGYVYDVVFAGQLSSDEPEWWAGGHRQVGTATLEARPYLRPLAHGPVDYTLT